MKFNLITEDIEMHDTLNPKLWTQDDELRPEVRTKILEIVKLFKDSLLEDEVEVNIIDIVVIGSSANYNYTKDSDIDVHIIVDSKLDCNEGHLAKLYSAYRSLFNNKYDISIKGLELEIFVELDSVHANSNGIYSLLTGWIKKPTKFDITGIDIEQVEATTDELEDAANVILLSPSTTAEDIGKIVDRLYAIRQAAVAKEGEYGEGNLVFKEFRNRGNLQKLKDKKVELTNKQLSLENFSESLHFVLTEDLSLEQDAFFRKSKVRDKDGQLLTCYRGTNKTDKSNNRIEWFTTNKAYAEKFMKVYGQDGDLLICYLACNHLLDVGDTNVEVYTNNDLSVAVLNILAKLNITVDLFKQTFKEELSQATVTLLDIVTTDKFGDLVYRAGYDCIHSYEGSTNECFGVLDSTLVKSVTEESPLRGNN